METLEFKDCDTNGRWGSLVVQCRAREQCGAAHGTGCVSVSRLLYRDADDYQESCGGDTVAEFC